MFSEEIVGDGIDHKLDIGIDIHHILTKLLNGRISQKPCCKRKTSCSSDTIHPIHLFTVSKTLSEFIHQKSGHSHSIFQLQITIITVCFRKIPICKYIPLITGMYKMRTVFLNTFPLIPLDQINHLTGIFLLKGFQRIQSLAIFRQANRHHGYAFQIGQILHQLFNRIR